jgi:ribonucleoside-diphosphate reductase alpha chain
MDGGQRVALDLARLQSLIESACVGLGADVKPEPIVAETMRNLYDGVPMDEVYKASILAARTLIEKDPDYTYATARLLLHTIVREVLGRDVAPRPTWRRLRRLLPRLHQEGCRQRAAGRAPGQYDLQRLGAALKPSATCSLTTSACKPCTTATSCTCANPHRAAPGFLHARGHGPLAQRIDREARAIEFYEVLSSFDFMSSTPTLFNSGTLRSQLSSCYLTTVPDDLDGIYESIKENALLSKFAGGLGNDWTRVRALGSHIKGTNGESQGVVPFLKVVNDTAVAVNQGGKRKGAVCTYLETWHLDIEEFLELRKNTGDDRRRTHDMNTANWIPTCSCAA